MKDINLQDKVAIITGGGRGIGREIALVMAEYGADIVIVSRSTDELNKTSDEIKSIGGNSLALTIDVTQSGQVDYMVEKSIDKFGKIDILINNAGELLRAPVVPLSEVELHPPHVTRFSNGRMSDEEWESVINTNLNSVFYCCRAVAPYMISRRYGKIVNISSNNASQAFPLVSAYNASKAAVNMLTKVLALEWAESNILVNAIGPGDYNTKMTEPTWIDPSARKKHLDGIPLGREGSLRELGILAAYLSSPATDYMTGQVIYMDGGLTAKNL